MTYSQLIAYINTYIKQNGNREITGVILNQALIDYMISSFPYLLYDETRPNVAGNVCVYNGIIYICDEDHPAGAFDSDKWTALTEAVISNHSELNELAYEDSGHTGFSPEIHDHAGQSINPDNVLLDKGYTDTEAGDLDVGTLFFNSDQNDWLLKTSADTYYNLGSEVSPLMKNGDTFTHLNGVPVYVFGGTGKLPVVKLADADAISTSHIIALATQDVVHTGNASGRYCTFGNVNGVPIANVIKSGEDSALWVEGAILYVSSETGKLTTVAPISPAHAVKVGYITDKSGSNVSIFVNIQAGSELSESHDVLLTNTQVDDILIKDTNYWKNIAKSTFLSGLESILTFSSGLTRAVNTITNNLITGLAGGQTIKGGTAASENLTITSTDNATKGNVIIGNSAYDEVNNCLFLDTATRTNAGSNVLRLGTKSSVTTPQLSTSITGGIISSSTGGGLNTTTTTIPTLLAEYTGARSTTEGGVIGVGAHCGVQLLSGNLLGGYVFTGSTGATGAYTGGIISAYATETWTPSLAGTRLLLSTVQTGTATMTSRINIQDGKIGIGNGANAAPTTITNTLSINGNAAVTVGGERHTTADTAGNSLTLNSGGATSGATDKSAGNLILKTGTPTGTGTADIIQKTPTASATSGTSDNAPVDRECIYTRILADNGTFALASGRSGMAWVTFGDNEEYAWFTFSSAGAVTLIAYSSNVTIAQGTNDKLNIYDAGTNVTLENTFTASKVLTIKVIYNI